MMALALLAIPASSCVEPEADDHGAQMGEAAVAEALVDDQSNGAGDDGNASCEVLEALPPDEGAWSPASASGVRQQGLAQPLTVFVNFDGPLIRNCACSDAINNRSLVIRHAFNVDSKDFAPYTSTTGKRAIMGYLRQWFAPYNITFTTRRPASGPYTMLVITPTWWRNHGVAPLDCGNRNPNDIGFVFRTGNTSRFPTHAAIAKAAAHEIGHTLGLAHVTSRAEAMQYASSGSGFGRSTYDTAHPSGKCFEGNTQNARQMLLDVLGPRP